MGSDGASYGVPAGRALKTIISGAPQPTEDELESVQEMRDRILGTPIRDSWSDSIEFGTEESNQAYEECCYAIAHAFLDEFMREPGSASLDMDSLYDKVKYQYEEDSPERHLFGGLTGFQVGWAFNAARRCVELEPVPNPAILTISTPDEGLK